MLFLVGVAFFQFSELSKFPCPKTEDEWMGARADLAAFVTWDRSRDYRAEMQACLTRNETLFNKSKRLKACVAPLTAYWKHLQTVPEPPGGLDDKITKQRYYKDSAKFTDLPKDLENGAFQKALVRGDVPAAIKWIEAMNLRRRKAKEPELVFAEVAGVHAMSSDSTGSRRFLVYDPGKASPEGRTEQWINFTLADPGATEAPFQLSVVATRWDAKGGAQTYFADHLRTDREPYAYRRASEERDPKSPDCAQCHLTGKPLRIDPKGPVARRFRKALAVMNAAIDKVPPGKPPGFAEDFFTKGRIPVESSNLPDDFLKACLGGAPTDMSLKKVRAALRCDRCHTGKKLFVLPIHIQPSLNHVMENGRMPPDNNLSDEERQGLVRCLARYETKIDKEQTKVGLAYFQLMASGGKECGPLTFPSGPGKAGSH